MGHQLHRPRTIHKHRVKTHSFFATPKKNLMKLNFYYLINIVREATKRHGMRNGRQQQQNKSVIHF